MWNLEQALLWASFNLRSDSWIERVLARAGRRSGKEIN